MNISLDPIKPTYTFEEAGQMGLKVKQRPYYCSCCNVMTMDSTNHTTQHYDGCKKWTCRSEGVKKYFDAGTMKIGLKSFNVFSGHNGSLLVHYAKIEHNNYRVTFVGRNRGAIGEFYSIVAYLDSPNESDVMRQLYDSHEHITDLKIEQIKVSY